MNSFLTEDFFFLDFPYRYGIKEKGVNLIGNIPLSRDFTIPKRFRTENVFGSGWRIINEGGRSEVVEDGYIIMGEEQIVIDEANCLVAGDASGSFNTAPVVNINDDGFGVMGIIGLFPGGDAGTSEISNYHQPIFKITEDYGQTWHGPDADDECSFYYIGDDFRPGNRASRIINRILELPEGKATVEDMSQIHSDRLSIPASVLFKKMLEMNLFSKYSQNLVNLIKEWDFVMNPDSKIATLYSMIRKTLIQETVMSVINQSFDDFETRANKKRKTHT